MIVIMGSDATEEQMDHVVTRIRECGCQAHLSRGTERTVIGVVGSSNDHRSELEALLVAPGVEEIIRMAHPFKLASRHFRPEGSVVDLGKGVLGGRDESGGGGRAVRCRVARANQRYGRAGGAGRCEIVAWRRIQAAIVAVLVPGAGREGAGADAARG